MSAADAEVVAECEHCGEILCRSLEAGDGLSAEDNQEIGERIARNHEHTCPASGEEWTETVTVDVAIDATGGE